MKLKLHASRAIICHREPLCNIFSGSDFTFVLYRYVQCRTVCDLAMAEHPSLLDSAGAGPCSRQAERLLAGKR